MEEREFFKISFSLKSKSLTSSPMIGFLFTMNAHSWLELLETFWNNEPCKWNKLVLEFNLYGVDIPWLEQTFHSFACIFQTWTNFDHAFYSISSITIIFCLSYQNTQEPTFMSHLFFGTSPNSPFHCMKLNESYIITYTSYIEVHWRIN